ncbi:hypothetical protein GE21DRAFT_1015633 [Neurospora crassa]|nr:hypothetical protein GE21DRAFT_1015633 [Neurospora crassa]
MAHTYLVILSTLKDRTSVELPRLVRLVDLSKTLGNFQVSMRHGTIDAHCMVPLSELKSSFHFSSLFQTQLPSQTENQTQVAGTKESKKTYIHTTPAYSPVVTDPITRLAVTGLSRGERTGSRVFCPGAYDRIFLSCTGLVGCCWGSGMSGHIPSLESDTNLIYQTVRYLTEQASTNRDHITACKKDESKKARANP